MNRFPATRLLVVLAMLLSIAGGPVVASGSGEVTKACQKMCCCHMACCAAKVPAHEAPAPVQPRVGQELAAPLTAAPFALLFTLAPTEAKRAPRALFADGHSPAPLAAGCIRLI